MDVIDTHIPVRCVSIFDLSLTLYWHTCNKCPLQLAAEKSDKQRTCCRLDFHLDMACSCWSCGICSNHRVIVVSAKWLVYNRLLASLLALLCYVCHVFMRCLSYDGGAACRTSPSSTSFVLSNILRLILLFATYRSPRPSLVSVHSNWNLKLDRNNSR